MILYSSIENSKPPNFIQIYFSLSITPHSSSLLLIIFTAIILTGLSIIACCTIATVIPAVLLCDLLAKLLFFAFCSIYFGWHVTNVQAYYSKPSLVFHISLIADPIRPIMLSFIWASSSSFQLFIEDSLMNFRTPILNFKVAPKASTYL